MGGGEERVQVDAHHIAVPCKSNGDEGGREGGKGKRWDELEEKEAYWTYSPTPSLPPSLPYLSISGPGETHSFIRWAVPIGHFTPAFRRSKGREGME